MVRHDKTSLAGRILAIGIVMVALGSTLFVLTIATQIPAHLAGH